MGNYSSGCEGEGLCIRIANTLTTHVSSQFQHPEVRSAGRMDFQTLSHLSQGTELGHVRGSTGQGRESQEGHGLSEKEQPGPREEMLRAEAVAGAGTWPGHAGLHSHSRSGEP